MKGRDQDRRQRAMDAQGRRRPRRCSRAPDGHAEDHPATRLAVHAERLEAVSFRPRLGIVVAVVVPPAHQHRAGAATELLHVGRDVADGDAPSAARPTRAIASVPMPDVRFIVTAVAILYTPAGTVRDAPLASRPRTYALEPRYRRRARLRAMAPSAPTPILKSRSDPGSGTGWLPGNTMSCRSVLFPERTMGPNSGLILPENTTRCT